MEAFYGYDPTRTLEKIKELIAQKGRENIFGVNDIQDLSLNPRQIYMRKDIGGNTKESRIQLVDQNVDYDIGRTNLDKGKLESGNWFFIESILLAAKVSASAPEAVGDYSTVSSEWDAALANGKLRIYQNNGKLVEFENHIFMSEALPTVSKEKQGFTLPFVKYLAPQQLIRAEIEPAGTVSADMNVELTLFGTQIEINTSN